MFSGGAPRVIYIGIPKHDRAAGGATQNRVLWDYLGTCCEFPCTRAREAAMYAVPGDQGWVLN